MLFGAMGILVDMAYFIYDNVGGTIMVTTVGAEGLSFVKVVLLLPLIVLTSYLYRTLLYAQRKEKVFYLFVFIFVCVTLLYNFVLRPLSPVLDVSKETLDTLCSQYPAFRVPLRVFGNWTTTFFYCVSSLYTEIIFGLVLWKIADDVVLNKTLLFPLISLVMCVGGVFTSILITQVNDVYSWDQAMNIFSGLLVIIFLLLTVLYNKINFDFKRHTAFDRKKTMEETPFEDNESSAPTLMQTLKFMVQDRVSFFLIMTVAFAFSHTVIELVWKDAVLALYPAQSDYSNFMALVGLLSSISFVVFSLVSVYTLRQWNWRMNASLSTTLLLIFTVIFFGGQPFVGKNMGVLILTPMMFCWLGALFIVVYPAADFGIYYPAARLTYDKMQPKQAETARLGFELLGENLGTTLVAALIQIGLLFGSIKNIAPFLGIALVLMCVVRLYYIRKLGKTLGLS